MSIRQTISRSASCAVAVTGIALCASGSPVVAIERVELQCGQAVASASEGSASSLERIRRECPLLGEIVERFVAQDLGEEFAQEIPQARTPAIGLIAVFAASGDIASVKRHAACALAAGATKSEFEELLYLTAVYAGTPKAIEATRALLDVMADRLQSGKLQEAHGS